MQKTIGGAKWSKEQYLNTCVAGAYGAALSGAAKHWELSPGALVGTLSFIGSQAQKKLSLLNMEVLTTILHTK